ncbi:MAG: hypothetical protein B7Y03_06600 [Polaromonas sp. 24-62-144]|nr:MAG: hypothetical protein B7Y03_06600 [Polaromonas sp. 24-62-144]
MAFKLLRLLRYMELPGKGWQGWHFSRGLLVTPEGRTIAGHESAWWSLLVRQANGFHELYKQAYRPCTDASDAVSLVHEPIEEELAARRGPGHRGDGLRVQTPPSNTGVNEGRWCESGAIMAPWPQISDCLLPFNPEPAATAMRSESASIPWSASPSISTSEPRMSPQSPPRRGNLSLQSHSLKKSLSLSHRPLNDSVPSSKRRPLGSSPQSLFRSPSLLQSLSPSPLLPSAGLNVGKRKNASGANPSPDASGVAL